MSVPTKIPHALHNEQVCSLLDTSKTCPDWVITTAFYASLHFVQDKLFPADMTIGTTTNRFDCFDKYYAVLRLTKKGISKHKATIYLVKKHLKPISADYKRLHDLCHDARYKDWIVPQQNDDLAIKILTKVKAVCLPHVVTTGGGEVI